MAIRTLGSRYLLDEQIGQGGMGVVWRGRDKVVGTEYAIKVLRQEYAADADAVTRFVRERTVLMKFRHPAVVSVHDMIVEGDQLALVMDLVVGGDLNGYQRRSGGTLPSAEAARIGAQICDGLAAAHAAGIVHRDLKPANVLLDNGQVRLADFGVARIIGDQSATTTGTVLGTAAYLAPELLTGSQASPACDVYALGITLYEVLGGQPPFGGHVAAIMHHHMETAPARIPAVPDPLWDLVSACLAKKPEDRPTAEALAASLRTPALLGALSAAAPVTMQQGPVAARPPAHAPTVLAPLTSPAGEPDLATVTSLPPPPVSPPPAGPVSPFPAGFGHAPADAMPSRAGAAPIGPVPGNVPPRNLAGPGTAVPGQAGAGAGPAGFAPVGWQPNGQPLPNGQPPSRQLPNWPPPNGQPPNRQAPGAPRPAPRPTPPSGHPGLMGGPGTSGQQPGWNAGLPGIPSQQATAGQQRLIGQQNGVGQSTAQSQPAGLTRQERHARRKKQQRVPSTGILAAGGAVALLAVLVVVALVAHLGPFSSAHKTAAGATLAPAAAGNTAGSSTGADSHPSASPHPGRSTPGRRAKPSSSPSSKPTPSVSASSSPAKPKRGSGGRGPLVAYGSNLLTDGTFTQPTLTAWNYAVQNATIEQGDGVGGGNAVQLIASTPATVSQTISGLTPGTTYKLTGYVYTNGGEQIYLGVMDTADPTIRGQQVTTSASWQELSATYKVPAGQTSVAIFCIMHQGGTGYCSDFSFRAMHHS